MAWPDHFAKGFLAFLLIGLPHGCFAGCLGRIILPQVCFHFFSFVLHMIALLEALAGSFCQRFPFISLPFVSHMVALLDALGGAFCHRFACISFHVPPTYLLCWMPWVDHLAEVFFHFVLFVSQMTVLLDALVTSFSNVQALILCLLHDFWLLDALAVCIMLLFLYIFQVSPAWCLLLEALDHFAVSLFAFLDICLLHGVSSWMSWLKDFAPGLLACLFFCLPHGVSCLVPFPNGVSCWMPWLSHFPIYVLLVSLPYVFACLHFVLFVFFIICMPGEPVCYVCLFDFLTCAFHIVSSTLLHHLYQKIYKRKNMTFVVPV